MKKSLFFLTILLLFFNTNSYSHNEWVHQWMILQAWELLKQQVPEIVNTPLALKIGELGGSYYKNVDGFWYNESVTGGAWAEDITDAIFVENNVNELNITATHFWDADYGDYTYMMVISAPFCNAHSKADWMYYGSPTIIDRYEPIAIQETFDLIEGGEYTVPPNCGIVFQYDGLANLYKSKKIKIIGYFLATQGVFPLNWNAFQSSSIYFHLEAPIEVYVSQQRVNKFVWNILGRIAHLLGDMSVPVHTKNGYEHPQGLPTAILHPCNIEGNLESGDTYEKWMSSPPGSIGCYAQMPSNFNAQSWTYLHTNVQNGLINVLGMTNPLRYLFYSLNQITQYFPNENVGGNYWSGNTDIYGGSNQGFAIYQGDDYSIIGSTLQGFANPPQIIDYNEIADVTFSFAIRATAGLLNLFASDAGLLVNVTIDNNFTATGGENHGTIVIDGTNCTVPKNGYSLLKVADQNITISANTPQYDNHGYQRIWHAGGTNNSNWTSGDEVISDNQTYSFNVTAEAHGKKYVANLRKICAISKNEQTEFDMVSTPTSITQVVELNSTQILTQTQKTINGITVSYLCWDDGNSDNPRIIVPQTNETYTALYKYPHHSNKNEAFSNNNQRKVVQQSAVNQNTMHMVYESMGLVWYERSTDNGNTWQIANNGRPLSYLPSKSPSIDYFNNDGNGDDLIIIAFQHQQAENNENSVIVVQFFKNGVKQFEGNAAISNCSFCEYDMTPVIAYGHGSGRILVVYKEITGLFCKYGLLKPSDSEIQWYSINPFIQSTTAESRNPSLVSYKNIYNNEIPFHLVWQEGETQIKYKKIVSPSSGYNTISQNSTQLLSGSGYTYNRYPSTTVMDDNIVRITWQGERTILSEETKDDDLGKSPAQTLQKRVLFTDPTANRFWGFGSNVGKPTINRSTDNLKYYMAWSEPYLGALNGKSVSNCLNGDSIKTLYGLTGTDIQVVNGATDSEIRAVSLNNYGGLPYNFQISIMAPSPLKKEELVLSGIGREGVVYHGSAQFYFMIGDVIVNGSEVDFVDVPASTVFSSDSVLNRYMQTETFTLDNSSEFLYSVQYGVTDSAAVENYLQNGNSISFAVELIDAATGALLGKFDEVTFNSQNIYQYDNLSYEVNTEGIGNREVYLRLATNNNGNVSRSLTMVGADASLIAKRHTKKVGFNGIAAVTDYALSQNYPNPFNPVTTINYQIPKDGFVSLKVYDILGKEIATLVNSDKAQGKYTVEFDGSRFASGMYIYKLQSGDFVETRKMMMLK